MLRVVELDVEGGSTGQQGESKKFVKTKIWKQRSFLSHIESQGRIVLESEVVWGDANNQKLRGCCVQIGSGECSLRKGESEGLRVSGVCVGDGVRGGECSEPRSASFV